MILAVYTCLTILWGAIALGLMDKALGPDLGRFPCATRPVLWTMRFYTLCLVLRAGVIAATLQTVAPRVIHWDIAVAATAMAGAHTALLWAVMQQKLPAGVWARLQKRQERVAQVARQSGDKGGVLAALVIDGAKVTAPGEGPEAVAGWYDT